MAMTRNDKKRAIKEYLSNVKKGSQLIELSSSGIIDSVKKVSEGEIDNLLEEMMAEEDIKRYKLSEYLYVPTEREEDFVNKFDPFLEHRSKRQVWFMHFYFATLYSMLGIMAALNSPSDVILTNLSYLVLGMGTILSGIVTSYLFQWLESLLVKNIPAISKYKNMILSGLSVFSLGIVILFIYFLLTSKVPGPLAAVTLIVGSIGTAFEYGRWENSKNE